MLKQQREVKQGESMHYDKLIKVLGDCYEPFSAMEYATALDGSGNGMDAAWNTLDESEQKIFIEYMKRVQDKMWWFTLLSAIIDTKIFKAHKMFLDRSNSTGVMDIKTYFETIKRLRANAEELEEFAVNKIRLTFPVHPSHIAYRLKHTLENFSLSRNDRKLYLSLFKEVGYSGAIKQSKATGYIDLHGYSEEENHQKQFHEIDMYHH